MAAVHDRGFTLLDHLPYTPELFSVSEHGKHLAGRHYQSKEEVIAAVAEIFMDQFEGFYTTGIQGLFLCRLSQFTLSFSHSGQDECWIHHFEQRREMAIRFTVKRLSSITILCTRTMFSTVVALAGRSVRTERSSLIPSALIF